METPRAEREREHRDDDVTRDAAACIGSGRRARLIGPNRPGPGTAARTMHTEMPCCAAPQARARAARGSKARKGNEVRAVGAPQ